MITVWGATRRFWALPAGSDDDARLVYRPGNTFCVLELKFGAIFMTVSSKTSQGRIAGDWTESLIMQSLYRSNLKSTGNGIQGIQEPHYIFWQNTIFLLCNYRASWASQSETGR